jgi:hypothetical protein
VLLAVALLVSCGDDGETTPTTIGPDPEDLGLPPDAEQITTPEGDRVWLSESQGSVYGECSVIEPHEDDVAGWLEVDPPRGFTDYGVVCI